MFKNWIEEKLTPSDRGELLNDLLEIMTPQELAHVVDAIATELNDAGYDWDSKKETQVETVNLGMLNLEEMFEATEPGLIPILRSDEDRKRAVEKRAFAGIQRFAADTLWKHHGVDEYGAYDEMMEMGF